MKRKGTPPGSGKKSPGREPRKTPATRPSNPLMLNGQSWDREKVMDIVCNAIASSSRSVTTILEAGYQGWPLPDYSTFARWIAEKKEGDNPLAALYRSAKEAQADYMAEELTELHNKAWVPLLDKSGDLIFGPDGRMVMTVNKASAAIVRLEADNKKWLMGKLRPKRYGDKITNELAPNDALTQLLHDISTGSNSAFVPVPDPENPA